MKITIEPTEPQTGYRGDSLHRKVSVEIPQDNLTVGEAMNLFLDAMAGAGYMQANLEEYRTDND